MQQNRHKCVVALLCCSAIINTQVLCQSDDVNLPPPDEVEYTEGCFLYDLNTDFTESVNVYESDDYSAIKSDLMDRISSWSSAVGEPEIPDTTYMKSTWKKNGGITSWIDIDYTPVTIEQKYSYDKAPHIVFVLVDDWGYNDIGYRSTYMSWATPNIDRLASEGIKLENYYNHYSCVPSRSAFMTGKYAFRNGLHLERSTAELPLNQITIAQELKSAGYHTYLVGKWHLGASTMYHLPQNRGFDSFFGYYSGFIDYWTKTYSGYLDLQDNDSITTNEDEIDSTNHNGYVLQSRAELAIENYAMYDSADGKPMFLYYAMQLIHGEWNAPQRFLDRCSTITVPGDIGDDYVADVEQKYCAMTVMLDEAIANLTCTLQRLEMDDNTVMIVVSDNGGEDTVQGNNYPMRGSKGSYFQGGLIGNGFIHSPLIPTGNRGSSYYGQIHITDWLPTLMGLATDKQWTGSYIGDVLDGVDVWEAILENTTSPHTEIVHYHDGQNASIQYNMYRLIGYDNSPNFESPKFIFESDLVPGNANFQCVDGDLLEGSSGDADDDDDDDDTEYAPSDDAPTELPSKKPSKVTDTPTELPSKKPSKVTDTPTTDPTKKPSKSNIVTDSPSEAPSLAPSSRPTIIPTAVLTKPGIPTRKPSSYPTMKVFDDDDDTNTVISIVYDDGGVASSSNDNDVDTEVSEDDDDAEEIVSSSSSTYSTSVRLAATFTGISAVCIAAFLYSYLNLTKEELFEEGHDTFAKSGDSENSRLLK